MSKVRAHSKTIVASAPQLEGVAEEAGSYATQAPDLEQRVEALSRQILAEFPEVDDHRHLLRPAMLEALLAYLPCSRAEFAEQIPRYLREGTDVEEARQYLDTVLQLIADYG